MKMKVTKRLLDDIIDTVLDWVTVGDIPDWFDSDELNVDDIPCKAELIAVLEKHLIQK